MLYFSTNLTEEEIKVLIDERRKIISKLENQRSLIAFLVLLTLISVFLLGIVGNILLTIFSFIIGSLVLLFLIGISPRQSNTDQLEYEIEELNKLLVIQIEDRIKKQEIDRKSVV